MHADYLHRLLFNTHMVTIEVGIEKEHFVVHQSFLCAKSQYFAKALSGSFKESITRFIQLPDVSPILFRIFVTWIYHDKLIYLPPNKTTIDQDFESLRITEKDLEQKPVLHDEPQKRSSNDGSDSEDSDDDMTVRSATAAISQVSDHGTSSHSGPINTFYADRTTGYNEDDPATWNYDVLVKLYVFADRFDTPQLRADSLDALVGIANDPREIWDHLCIRYIYMNTPAQSKLRDYAVHSTAYRCSFDMNDHDWEKCPCEFLAAVMTINSKRLPIKQCDGCYEEAVEQWDEEEFVNGELSREEDLPPYERDLCFYHEHSNDEDREACRKRRGKPED